MTQVEALLVQSDSDCPSAEAVQAEVRELTTAEQRRGVPPGARAVISDRGETIAIAVTRDGKTTVRVYHDAARDCARRGHFVSVLVVVSLMPPELGSDPEAATSTPPAREVPAPGEVQPPAADPQPKAESGPEPRAGDEGEPSEREPVGRSEVRRVRIELAARASASTPISDSARVAGFGGALGVALGAGDTRFTLTGGYSPKSELRYTGRFAGRADLERLDLALGARFRLGDAPVATSFDAGLLFSRAVVTGLDSLRPARGTAVSPGARAGFHVCWSDRSRLSPFLGAYADMYPFAPALSQLPQGTVGHLPYVWVGVSGGLALAL